MKTIIASDFDRTLAFEGKVSPQNRDAVAAFRRAGGLFGVVTGRHWSLALPVLRDVGTPIDFLICCTGGVILDGEGNVLSCHEAPCDLIPGAIKMAKETGAHFFGVTDKTQVYMADLSEGILPQADSLTSYTHCNCGFHTLEDAEKFVSRVKAAYGDGFSAYQNVTTVDMPPPGISKVTGIYEYASLIGADRILTVGDNVNDLSMIEEFESYAVANAVPAVKAAAKHQCQGVWDMIEQVLSQM